ncbi:alpha/beta fold hydrolase [Chelativorans salis]|uniref:Alpha/beta hydrolase n=1 Tax=Chelativorans salis TaxID=2978478 RepID=A0ABT2LND3_9HYPH|nr:alpha/beta hydrolase [Chelativorans sp. EGI FJ00035]MCT7374913.1 alpha/beta hydrolase [Chelativorans sp. EGI FJ00035]
MQYLAISALAGLLLFAAPPLLLAQEPAPPKNQVKQHPQTPEPDRAGYASVHGLEMYYEIYGEGEPLLLLHGAYGTIGNNFGAFIPALAEHRQVIGVELQGHGRTADIDRPITYEAMAADVAALMDVLEIGEADIFGYSMGGGVAIRLAIDRPDLVRRLVAAAATFKTEGMYPEVYQMIQTITPETFAGTPFEEDYLALAPNPEDWPVLVEKLKALDKKIQDWPESEIRGIEAPVLIIIGDGDIVRPEHAVEMFRLLRGGVPADLTAPPASQLAIVPGATHITLMFKTDLLLSMIVPFLDAAIPDGKTD